MSPAVVAGWSALAAAAATVVSAVALVLFFQRGDPWGRLNDVGSVVLMLTLIPVALLIATLETETVTTLALPVAGLGIGAMVVAAVLQALLVAQRVPFERTRRPVLVASAVVGAWYVLAGLLAGATELAGLLAALAILAGVGLIGTAAGFALVGERHAATGVAGVLAFGGSLAFLSILGVRLVSGDLVVPAWNA